MNEYEFLKVVAMYQQFKNERPLYVFPQVAKNCAITSAQAFDIAVNKQLLDYCLSDIDCLDDKANIALSVGIPNEQ